MTEHRIKIHQEWANGAGISAEVVKGRELQINQRKKKRTRQYKIDLLALESVSRKRTKFAWRWFITGLALLLIVVLNLVFTIGELFQILVLLNIKNNNFITFLIMNGRIVF